MTPKAGSYNRRIRIERPVADGSFDGAGSGSWVLVREIAASVQDALPSRGEKLAEGINLAARPSRVRMRYRTDVQPEMRFLIGKNVRGEDGELVWVTDRTVQIISGPAEIGFRDQVEFMVEEYRPAGNAA